MTKTNALPAPQYLIDWRQSICVRRDDAGKGHPKPELVASIDAELDRFDQKYPHVRGARRGL